MKKIAFVFGTRPEAIKMIPIIKEIEKHPNMEAIVINTGQHKEMIDNILEMFDINVSYNLNIMFHGQTVTSITTSILNKLDEIFNENQFDVVLVHGDTTTALAAALSTFYHQIKIGHVEAGLRSYNLLSPFPEEANRQLIDRISDFYFCPTVSSKENLLNEGIDANKLFVVGNSSIDMLNYTVKKEWNDQLVKHINKKIILLTTHRRENLNDNMDNIFAAINQLLAKRDDIHVIFPIHKNPVIREKAKIITNKENIDIIEPLEVIDFHNIINESHIILTDSGGIQEEAPYLGKPVLVLRENTERPEGVEAGCLKLIGTNSQDIIDNINLLLDNEEEYNKMAKSINPYGDGLTSVKIVNILEKELNGNN